MFCAGTEADASGEIDAIQRNRAMLPVLRQPKEVPASACRYATRAGGQDEERRGERERLLAPRLVEAEQRPQHIRPRFVVSLPKAIADSCAVSGRTFSQSEMCDFLTVAAKGVDSKRAGAKTVNDATFHIYIDIMENYQKADEKTKLHYPRIIVDTISALDKGVDTRGEAVGVYSLDRYYQERKSTAVQEDPAASYAARPPGAVESPSGFAAHQAAVYSAPESPDGRGRRGTSLRPGAGCAPPPS